MTTQMTTTQDTQEGDLTHIPEATPARNHLPTQQEATPMMDFLTLITHRHTDINRMQVTTKTITQQEHALLGAPMTPDIPEARAALEAQVAQEAPAIPEIPAVPEAQEDLEVSVDEEALEAIITRLIKTTLLVMDIPNNNTPCPNNLITRCRTPLL